MPRAPESPARFLTVARRFQELCKAGVVIATNGDYLVAKCAFQMITKSREVAGELSSIASRINGRMRELSQEMAAEMRNPAVQTPRGAFDVGD